MFMRNFGMKFAITMICHMYITNNISIFVVESSCYKCSISAIYIHTAVRQLPNQWRDNTIRRTRMIG